MKKAFRIIARVFLCLITVVLILGGTLFGVLSMIAGDTSPAARQMFVTTLLETGQLKFLAGLVASEEEIQAMVNTVFSSVFSTIWIFVSVLKRYSPEGVVTIIVYSFPASKPLRKTGRPSSLPFS